MQSHRLGGSLLLVLLFCSHLLTAEDKPRDWRNEIYAGYSYLSSSFNAYSTFTGGGMNGWDAAFSSRLKGGLGIKVAAIGYYSTNNDAKEIEHSILVGPQYSKHFGKESAFVHGLVGLGFINSGAIPFDNSGPSSNATLAALAGGGLDSPISKRLAWRIEGDYLRTQFNSSSDQIHGLHGNFARVSTGLVFRF